MKGLVARVAGSHTYLLTSYGRRVAYLTPALALARSAGASVTRLQQCIFNLVGLALATAADVPASLAKSFREIDAELERLVDSAHLAPAGI